MSDSRKNTKRVQLKETLLERIVSGEFSYGNRFPGLHQLCQQYKASYVTVSRAMKLLEKEGYLQAQNGVGYFVSYIHPDIVSSRKIVNFITALSPNTRQWHLMEDGKKLFEEAGWEVNCYSTLEPSFSFQLLNSPDAYNVLFSARVNWSNFTANLSHVAQRVVVIGQLSGNPDITSIISDEYETVRRAIEYFRNRKRFKTAIVCASPERELDMLRTAAWRSIMQSCGYSLDVLDHLCCTIDGNSSVNDETHFRQTYAKWLRINKKYIDSIIISFSPLCFLNACQDTAVQVPDDIAVLAIARSSKPDNTSIPFLDHNLSGHFKCALEILEERFKTGRKAPGAWHFVPPGELFH